MWIVLSDSRWDPVADFCGHSDEFGMKFLDQLRDFQFFKKDPAPLSLSINQIVITWIPLRDGDTIFFVVSVFVLSTNESSILNELDVVI